MKHVFLTVVVFCFTFISLSQSFTAQIIDTSNGNPIPYASIKTAEHRGTISNEEGFFTLYLDENLKTITISCMGYEEKVISVADLNTEKPVIKLNAALNQLDEVFISNKSPNARSIIAKVKENLGKNYDNKLNKYGVFSRTTNYIDFKKLEFEIEKASHVKKRNLEAANAELMAMANDVRNSNMIQFEDFKADFFSLDIDSSKIDVSKATMLLDHKNGFSLNDIQERSQRIVLKYLDSSKTYKIKSGWFKLEDSLDLNDEKLKDLQKKEYKLHALNTNTKNGLKKAQFYDDGFLNQFLDDNLYDYSIENTSFNNDAISYQISFTPRKGKAKYSGQLTVTDDNYAITRVDYGYHDGRHGSKINLKLLLGVKYIHTISKGMILYEKNSKNIYQPKYLKHNYGNYFYASRDVKFIENSRDKRKVGFSFTLEGKSRSKQELLFTEQSKISLEAFKAIKQDSVIPYQELKKFDKSIWENEEILEPLEEMKSFSSDF